MPSRYLATVACPACGTRFQTPIEQIIDVRVDPEARNRMIGGAINVAICPACGMGGSLNVPFIYHDPENEVALLYLPVEVGRTEVERQQVAGRLNRQLMDSIPMEERKGYLLQPETFISMESMLKRVLELEGVTEEDMERSRQQRVFLDVFVSALEEEWPKMLEEHDDLLDESFFGLLEYTMQMAAMASPNNLDLKKFQDAYDFLVDNSTVGQQLVKRTQVMREFADAPSQESLLQALINAPDDQTVAALVQSGLPLMDYSFFQILVKRIEAAGESEEKARLSELRRTILQIRDAIRQAGQDVAGKRAELLQKLLSTEDPLKMARSYLSELDDVFFYVLGSELREAQQRGNKKTFEALQAIAGMVNKVMEENMPPELVLLRRLLMAPTEEQVQQLLESNRAMLKPAFFQMLEELQNSSRPEDAERVAKIRAIAGAYVSAEAAPQKVEPQPQSSPKPPASETQTSSGLIIAKR